MVSEKKISDPEDTGSSLRVLQLNHYESPGRRFSGLSLSSLLKARGVDSTHVVWEKDSSDPSVLTLGNTWQKSATRVVRGIERVLSVQSMLHLNSLQLTRIPAYKQADLLHLHIIHSGYLSLWALPGITHQKPTVWTLHDPWAMTGHCVYPFDCERWKTGCGACPNLKTTLPLNTDRTSMLFKYKRRVYAKSKFDIIVASQWMLNMVQASPLFEHARVHHVPFGLNLDFFSSSVAPDARSKLGIPDNALVICFRAVNNEFKGLPYAIEALERIHSNQPVCLLTFQGGKDLLERFAGRFQLVDLGWSNDEVQMRDAFVAADIFLMPSMAEAFGVMAIEAMACGKPVISFDGTSLPEVTFAPDVGISVPMKDSAALSGALQRLIDFPEERLDRGRKGRLIAESHYDERMQADRLVEIYRTAAAK